jgi:hypothetical protein
MAIQFVIQYNLRLRTRTARIEMGGMPTLKEFVDAMSVGWPIAMSVFVACTGLLVADYWQIVYFANAPAWILTVLFVVAVFSGSICATELVRLAARGIRRIWDKMQIEKIKKLQIARLNQLNDSETEILQYLYSMKTQHFPYELGEGRLVSLRQKGLITAASGTNDMMEWPHSVPDHVWNEMAKQHERFFVQRIERRPNPFRYI